MSRRQKLIFVAWCLFPFVLALGFRAVDNYQFDLERHRLHKNKPDYFPSTLGPEELNPAHEFTCHQLDLVTDTTRILETTPVK